MSNSKLSLLGENARRRLSIPELKGYTNNKRRMSIPEIQSLKDAAGSQRKHDCNDLPEGAPILSRSLLSMDRAITPEQRFVVADRAFTNLRPVSPNYNPLCRRLDSTGDPLEFSDEDSDSEKTTNFPLMSVAPSSPFNKQQFQIIRPKSKSNRYLVKIPIESKKAKKSAIKYPASMLSYERGVSPTPENELVQPVEPSLSSLRTRVKLRKANNFRKNLEILQLRFAAMEMEPEFEQMEKEMSNSSEADLLHIMSDDGKIMWKNINNPYIEDILDSDMDLNAMPTMDQNTFQGLDPEEIFDAYLTEKYIVLETDPDY